MPPAKEPTQSRPPLQAQLQPRRACDKCGSEVLGGAVAFAVQQAAGKHDGDELARLGEHLRCVAVARCPRQRGCVAHAARRSLPDILQRNDAERGADRIAQRRQPEQARWRAVLRRRPERHPHRRPAQTHDRLRQVEEHDLREALLLRAIAATCVSGGACADSA